VNLKKLFVGALFIVIAMYLWAYVEPFIHQYLPWIPTSFTFWLGFIPIPIGLPTILIILGVLLILFGLLA
jgi:hypothetical protein